MNTWFKTLLCAILSIALSTPASAARVHLVGAPTFDDLGENIETCLTLAGLGNKDVTITVEVTGLAEVTYFNPGGKRPAGQNKVPITEVSWETLPSTQIKNGTVSVCLTSPDADVGDPPNPNWTTRIDDIIFLEATITVVQRGKVVLRTTVDLEEAD